MDMVPSPHTNVTLSVLMLPSRQATRAVHMTKFDVTGLAVSLLPWDSEASSFLKLISQGLP